MTQRNDSAPDLPQDWPPGPLDHEWIKWYMGEWTGRVETPMGQSECKQKCELALGNQFLVIRYQDQSVPGGYDSQGMLTFNPDGEVVGYWIDNMRTLCHGKGRLEGNKLVMEWKDPLSTIVRTVERTSPNRSLETFTLTHENGQTLNGRVEFTRVN